MGGWNAGSVAASVALFVLAGVFEVGGGWLVWKACREVRIIRRGTARASTPIHLFRFFPGARLEKLASPTSLAARPRRSPPPPSQGKPWWWALCGSAALVAYGFVPCLQPLTDFGRLYAVYGGFFIALSYAWGAAFDGFALDAGDVIGGCIALAGVLVALFWPGREGPSSTIASASS